MKFLIPSIAGFAAAALLIASPALAARTAEEPKAPPGGFQTGFMGTHATEAGQAQLQRGLKVWPEVCSSWHAMHLVHIRDLGAPGGPFWNEKYPNPNDNPVVKAIAARYQISDIDTTTGDPIKRPGIPADPFPGPRIPEPVPDRARGGGGQRRRAASGPLDHRQGARRRGGVHLFAAYRLC